jgi:prepilin-type processing-associated H-X9-DG protein
MRGVGWWAASGGRLAAGDVLLSAHARINYRVPADFASRASLTPPVTGTNDYLFYNDRRMCAFGSSHSGGANFALADGSVRFIAENVPDLTLLRLCVRHDGGVVGEY